MGPDRALMAWRVTWVVFGVWSTPVTCTKLPLDINGHSSAPVHAKLVSLDYKSIDCRPIASVVSLPAMSLTPFASQDLNKHHEPGCMDDKRQKVHQLLPPPTLTQIQNKLESPELRYPANKTKKPGFGNDKNKTKNYSSGWARTTNLLINSQTR